MPGRVCVSDCEHMRKQPNVRELERVADVGGSSKTPLILFGEVWVVTAIAVLFFLALALLAYRLA
jgi:hypothetical protein